MAHSCELELFDSMPHEVYVDAVTKIAELNNLADSEKYTIEYSAGSSKGDNYIGLMFRIKIKCKKDNSVKMSLIAKFPPENAARRDEFKVQTVFHREIQFYDVLMPMYRQFQAQHCFEGFFEAPLVHLTLTEAPNEALFFEDLRMRNFDMFSRFEDFTKEHEMLVLKALAKLHAVFFCIKDQKPNLVKSFVGYEDMLIVLARNGKTLLCAWFEGQKKHALKALEKLENVEDKKKIEAFLSRNMNEMLEELVGTNVAEPYSTICHGDVWNNNMMFRNDEVSYKSF
jgi:hypothetical protein